MVYFSLGMAYFSLGMVTTTAHYYWKLQAPHSGESSLPTWQQSGNLRQIRMAETCQVLESLGNLKDLIKIWEKMVTDKCRRCMGNANSRKQFKYYRDIQEYKLKWETCKYRNTETLGSHAYSIYDGRGPAGPRFQFMYDRKWNFTNIIQYGTHTLVQTSELENLVISQELKIVTKVTKVTTSYEIVTKQI